MDSITHIFLGGAIGQVVAARKIGNARAFLVGALAATFPDFDVFLHTGDSLRDHAFHRHFMHSLVIVPVLAVVSMLPFLFWEKGRQGWRRLLAAALLACTSHAPLDLLTSYGTMILWPFSGRRYALDIIAVVDPLYTLPLIFGVLFAWKLKSVRPAIAALVLSCLYLGFAAFQHGRAQVAQRALLVSRGVANPQNPRVLPQVGAVISYRSIYIADGQIHADAIRVLPFSAPTFKKGGALALVTPADLSEAVPDAARAFAIFSELADGFVARSPVDRLLLADERYTYFPQGLEPVWGVQLEHTAVPLFHITPRWNYFGKLARDLFRPTGYATLQATPPRE